MVASQSRTLVRYRNMIARRAPSPLGCALAAHEQGTEACSQRPFAVNRGRRCVHDGPSRSQALPRERTFVSRSPAAAALLHAPSFLLPLEYLMALAESRGLGLPPARILVA